MNRSFLALAMFVFSQMASAQAGRLLPWQAGVVQPPPSPVSLQFDGVSVKQLVLVLYDSCLQGRGIVFDPSASAIDSLSTLRLVDAPCAAVEKVVRQVVESAGLQIQKQAGFDVLRKPSVDDQAGWEVLIYEPRFRDASMLSELAQLAIRKGRWAHSRAGIPISIGNTSGSAPVREDGQNVASQAAKVQERLVFHGPAAEAEAVRQLLVKLDTPPSQVEVRVGVYEYSSSVTEGGGVVAALDLFKGRVTASAGETALPGAAVARIAVGGIEAALALLDRDSRFRYVARPKLLVKDSQSARFFAGEEVRVSGATVVDGKGNPIVSRETLSAGVTLEVTPRVFHESVELSLYQAVSSFAAPRTGVDPATLKRDLRSTIVVKPGEVYVVGGLTSSKSQRGESRFFGWRSSVSDQSDQTEIVLIVSVTSAGQV